MKVLPDRGVPKAADTKRDADTTNAHDHRRDERLLHHPQAGGGRGGRVIVEVEAEDVDRGGEELHQAGRDELRHAVGQAAVHSKFLLYLRQRTYQ